MREFKHCDEYIDDESQPECLRQFLRYCRWPATYQFRAERLGVKKPILFADWQRYEKKGAFGNGLTFWGCGDH